jgi:hypothetical protein
VQRIRHAASLLGRELRALRTERATGGIRGSVRRRIEQHAGVEPLREELAGLRGQLDALRGRLDAAEELAAAGRDKVASLDKAAHDRARAEADQWQALAVHGQALKDQDQELHDLRDRVAGLEPLLAANDDLCHRVANHGWVLEELRHRVAILERAHSVQVFTGWIEQVRLTRTPAISVVMPTHNRAALLPRAVASVQAQHYADWELVIVDDDSHDETPQVLASLADPRIRSLRIPHGGVCAARNAGLHAASGEVIAYLDDDNWMHPLWLKSVAWALGHHPDVDVVYGGFVIDDVERVNRLGAGSLPRLTLEPYDRATLLRGNLADIGAIAHRAGLPGARFDESLIEMGDWDLLCALTAERDPMVLPAIACFYSTDAPNRLSGGPTFHADYATVRDKHAPADREETP